MAKYLVTGGAGFIGSHIVEALLDAGHEVRIFDNLSTGLRENVELFADRVEFHEGDLVDADAVRRAVAGVHGVFHEAALPSVPRSVEDPFSCHDANVTGSMHLLLAARDAGAKVVYAGSSSCYGETEELPKHEGMCVSPCSPYAAAKVAVEHYLECFGRCYNLPTVTVRYFNVFGPRQRSDSPYSGVIAKFCANALSASPCTIFGDGEQSRDFTYVKDVARGNLMAMEQDLPPGTCMNLAGGNRYSLLDLVNALEKLTGTEIERRFEPVRVGDVKHSQADVSRAKELLGFETEWSFEDGLGATLDWYRASQATAAESVSS